MTGLPEIIVVGTITADPEMRFTPAGVAVSNFSIAANERRFDAKAKEWADGGTTFLRCVVWRDQAENVCESFFKGDRVIILGELEQQTYDDKEGNRRTSFQLRVNEIGASVKFRTVKIDDVVTEDDDEPEEEPEPVQKEKVKRAAKAAVKRTSSRR